MAKTNTLVKSIIGRVLRVVLLIVLFVVFFIAVGVVLSFLFFFLFYLLGLFSMDYVDSEGGRMFFHILILLLYLVAFVLEGAVVGFYIGTRIQIKRTIMSLKLFQRMYNNVMEKLYTDMKKECYIATEDFDRHKGKERVSAKKTLSKMNDLIDEAATEESGGALGLFQSPLKWTTYRFGTIGVKRIGRIMLQRMSHKDKSGDEVIFLFTLEEAAEKGMWGFINRYLLNPLLYFTLGYSALFLLIVLLPIGLCWLATKLF